MADPIRGATGLRTSATPTKGRTTDPVGRIVGYGCLGMVVVVAFVLAVAVCVAALRLALGA